MPKLDYITRLLNRSKVIGYYPYCYVWVVDPILKLDSDDTFYNAYLTALKNKVSAQPFIHPFETEPFKERMITLDNKSVVFFRTENRNPIYVGFYDNIITVGLGVREREHDVDEFWKAQ